MFFLCFFRSTLFFSFKISPKDRTWRKVKKKKKQIKMQRKKEPKIYSFTFYVQSQLFVFCFAFFFSSLFSIIIIFFSYVLSTFRITKFLVLWFGLNCMWLLTISVSKFFSVFFLDLISCIQCTRTKQKGTTATQT